MIEYLIRYLRRLTTRKSGHLRLFKFLVLPEKNIARLLEVLVARRTMLDNTVHLYPAHRIPTLFAPTLLVNETGENFFSALVRKEKHSLRNAKSSCVSCENLLLR